MDVNVMVVRAILVTQSEDRSIIYFSTVLANEIYNKQAPAFGFNELVVYTMIVKQSDDNFVVYFATVLAKENQTLINHKCVCGALNRQLNQTLVICGFLKSNYVSIKLGKKLHCHLDIYSLF